MRTKNAEIISKADADGEWKFIRLFIGNSKNVVSQLLLFGKKCFSGKFPWLFKFSKFSNFGESLKCEAETSNAALQTSLIIHNSVNRKSNHHSAPLPPSIKRLIIYAANFYTEWDNLKFKVILVVNFSNDILIEFLGRNFPMQTADWSYSDEVAR